MNTKLTTTLFAMAAVGGAGLALADLKASAPKNVNMTALWKINAEQSDDPQKVVAKKRSDAAGGSRGGGGSSTGTSTTGGSVGGRRGGVRVDVGDIFGGGVFGGGTVTGGGTSNRGGTSDRPEGDPDQPENMRMPLDAFLATREEFEIQQQPNVLTISTVDETSTCKPGETAQVPMPNGQLADRRCGWQGGTFVMEIKSPDGVTRVNRYELRKNDKQLVMVSEIKGGKGQMSGLQIRRVYDRTVAF
jgi:hypothetical protein